MLNLPSRYLNHLLPHLLHSLVRNPHLYLLRGWLFDHQQLGLLLLAVLHLGLLGAEEGQQGCEVGQSLHRVLVVFEDLVLQWRSLLLESNLPQLGHSPLLELLLRDRLRADQDDILLAGCTNFCAFLLLGPLLQKGPLEGRTGGSQSGAFELSLLLVEVLFRLFQLAEPDYLLLERDLLVLHWHLQVLDHLVPPVLHTGLLWLCDFLVRPDLLLEGEPFLESADVHFTEGLARLNLSLRVSIGGMDVEEAGDGLGHFYLFAGLRLQLGMIISVPTDAVGDELGDLRPDCLYFLVFEL